MSFRVNLEGGPKIERDGSLNRPLTHNSGENRITYLVNVELLLV